MSKDILYFIIYPIVVLVAGGIITFIFSRIGKYFNRLDLTLINLNETIQLLILDQSQKHGEQNKRLEFLEEGLEDRKVIAKEHRKDINELFDITDRNQIDIELLKQGKEDK